MEDAVSKTLRRLMWILWDSLIVILILALFAPALGA